MKNSVIYMRVSTEKQAKKGYSLKYQEEILRKYCELKNINIVKSYKEDYSGKNFDRPQFNKLKDYMKQNKNNIDLLLLATWDRFGRNQYESLKIIRKFQAMGIEVNAIEQPLDLSDPDNKLMLSIYLTVPEIENDKNSLRTTKGMRKARKNGCWMGIAPFGYNNVRTPDGQSTLAPNEKAHLVKKAYEIYSKGVYSIEEVRKMLISEGLTINKQSFNTMLKRVVYRGKIIIKDWGKEEEQIVEGLHDSIISDDLFEKVQRIITGKNNQPEKKKP